MKPKTPTTSETIPFLCDDGQDVVVPMYVPPTGHSVDSTAAALGLRALGRREPRTSTVVAVIIEDGRVFGCVRK